MTEHKVMVTVTTNAKCTQTSQQVCDIVANRLWSTQDWNKVEAHLLELQTDKVSITKVEHERLKNIEFMYNSVSH